MEPGRLSYGDARSNIPHMQLFHHLKQKFPDLRDNDVNESIQKYGLDRERCEEELSQRTQVHPGGYYGPWGRTSPATSRLTSPVRGSTPSTPTTPLLAGGEYLCGGGGLAPLFTSTSTTAPAALHPGPVSYGWHPAVANGYRPAPRLPQDTSVRWDDQDRSKSRSSTPVAPTSAPVVPNSYDPFSREPPERRRSADNHHPPERPFSPPPAPSAMNPPAGLAATATATTTITTTTTTFTTFITTTVTNTTPINTTTTTSNTTINCTNNPVNGGSNDSSSSRSSDGDGGEICSRNSGRPPPVLFQDQLARKHRLTEELSRQGDEKDRLEAEVEMMVKELQAREQQRKSNADTNTMRIEEVQQENQRLQSECYEMENRILRLAPDFDLESYSSTLTQPNPGFPEGVPPPPATQPPQLTRGSSGSSLGSEMGTLNTPSTPYTPGYHPTRPAPPPPVPPAPPPPPSLNNHNYGQYQGHGGGRLEEASHKWDCSKCTFLNHPDMNMCEMCDFPRFTIGTTSPQRQAATTALSQHQGPCYCHHRNSHHHFQHSTGPPTGSLRDAVLSQHTSSCSSLPLSQGKPPSLTNILKDKLRDRRSDSV